MNLKLFAFPWLFLALIAAGQCDRNVGGGSGRSSSSASTAISSSSSKIIDKVSYPKKVTSLKKRPTKSSTINASTLITTPSATIADKSSLPKRSTSTLAATTKKKTVADVTEIFKDLPTDDLEFIKELDKQFKLHGDKIKIKVQHDNTTVGAGADNAKNSKRTIDGDLGYGYNHNGYDYSPPKYEFYPYSQKDIPQDAPSYYPKYETTSVTIEPSYSYELKPQTYIQPEEQPQIDLPHPSAGGGDANQQQHYDSPVIVLRIPGPAKYASHLQTLLQQYLEIRAAQYLRILEEAEHQKLQHEQHQQQQHQPQPPQPQYHEQQHPQEPQQYEQPPPSNDYQHSYEHHGPPQVQAQAPESSPEDYQKEVVYSHQMVEIPQPIVYGNVDDVYQNYRGRHQGHLPQHHHQQQQQHHQQQYTAQPESGGYYADAQAYHHQPASQPEAPQYYYMHEQHYNQGPQHAQAPTGHAYEPVYLIAMSAGPTPHPNYGEPLPQQPTLAHEHSAVHLQGQPIYVEEQEEAIQHQQQHQQHQPQQQEHNDNAGGGHLSQSISENYPGKAHTKVIFTQNAENNPEDYVPMYQLPSIRPFERHAPTSPAPLHQHHYEHQHQQQQQSDSSDVANYAEYHQHHHQQQQQQQQASQAATVEITQRPFNYHAHALKGRTRNKKRISASAAPAVAAVAAAEVVSSTVTTTTVEKENQQLSKIREYVRDKLGGKAGTTREFKTTQIIGG